MPKLNRLFILLTLFPVFGYSQELKSVEEQPFENVFIRYSVLKANPKIRQGLYQRFLTASRKLVEEGYYKNNKKDSLWTSYNILGDTTEKITYAGGVKNGYSKKWIFPFGKAVVIREGNYKADKRVGIWTFRKPDNSLDHSFDYSANMVTAYGKSEDASTFIDGKDTINAILERPPVHIGGMDTLYSAIARNIHMPIAIKRSMSLNFHYRAFVSFVINETGKLANYAIVRGTNKACNDEALRVIKLWDDGNWVPGNYDGHAVKVIMMIPIAFNMNVTDYGPPLPPNARIVH